MLETFRRNSRSFLIYLIFGALIVVFALSFGPQSVRSGRGGGCSSAAISSAATVNGQPISDASWRYGLLEFSGGSNVKGEKARQQMLLESVLDRLIVRELFAQRGEALGFRISDEEVRERTVGAGELYILGTRITARGRFILAANEEETPRFAARYLENYVQQMGLGSVDRFVEEQRRELLAAKVRDLITAGIRVSPEEVQQRYQLENSKVDLEFVTFSQGMAKRAVELTPADIDAYAKAHEAELKEQYDKDAARWKGHGKEVRLRDLFVANSRPAAAASQPASQPATVDPARTTAAMALAKIRAGQDFAAVVKETTPHALRGGDVGWRPMNGLRLGATGAEVVGKLEKNAVSEVIETPDGFHIVQLLDRREGDISFDDAKRDLAESGARDAKAKTMVKEQADKALARVKEGVLLDKQFLAEGAEPKDGPHLQTANGVARMGGFVPGLPGAPPAELLKAVFDELKIGEVASKSFDVGGDQVLIRVTKREEPDMQKFQTEKTKLGAQMAREKAQVTLADFAVRECRTAKEKGSISFDPDRVAYSETDARQKSAYQPCSTVR